MVILYLLSGPLVAAMCFVAFLLTGTGLIQAVIFSFLIGCSAPALIAGLHFLFNGRLRVKIAEKSAVKTGN